MFDFSKCESNGNIRHHRNCFAMHVMKMVSVKIYVLFHLKVDYSEISFAGFSDP